MCVFQIKCLSVFETYVYKLTETMFCYLKNEIENHKSCSFEHQKGIIIIKK